MHTVRNRVASKPRPMGKAKPAVNRKRREPAFMLKSGHPPAFPAGLIVPPPRGAVIATVPWPAPARVESALITLPAKPARKPSGPRKARKARKSAARKHRSASGKQKRTRQVAMITHDKQEATAPMITADLLDRALAMQATPVEAAVIAVPPTPAPAAAPTLAAGVTPIPRSHAVAQHRSTALLDVIGYWLRDAGRRLLRWGQPRHRAKARVQVARANARLRAMQSQVEALEALREVARAD
ncbi:hypothetical protein GGQ88_000896 [Novosphingobium hassiacum]|uniref:Uncharacterized protein n=1 Tax=Novosphingobium hassiacum TaxID=173676 RepID=A0A7W5ZTH9_9SPHN|nr:hypothetical protein [Novosphingobium hassiacum]MBB3859656.1 hypothetical protein [Novosphingobium hassiacum]